MTVISLIPSTPREKIAGVPDPGFPNEEVVYRTGEENSYGCALLRCLAFVRFLGDG